jgi:hypothetical protein
MPNYQQGKIYKIISKSNTDLVYYGATTRSLNIRMEGHKTNKHRCKSKIIIDIGDAEIELVELYPCNSKKELDERERFYILNNKCVNKQIPLRTRKEYYQDNIELLKEYYKEHYKENADKYKEYREDNAEKMKEYSKEYKKENAEKLKEYRKEYYKDNAEKLKEYRKEYKKENAEKLKEYRKEHYHKNKTYILCECGANIISRNKLQHEKTKKHLNFLDKI